MIADDPPFYQNVKYKACSELACLNEYTHYYGPNFLRQELS